MDWDELPKKAIKKNFFYLGDFSKREHVTKIPEIFGKYRITELIGQGGAGEVYQAVDTTLQRQVALKILTRVSPHDLDRFYREAQITAKLDQPNIIKIYEIGSVNNLHYISMQYVEGEPLNREHLEIEDALKAIHKVALALYYAHSLGIVHRDIKPSNIIIDQKGEPYLTDFGIAKQIAPDKTSTLSIEGMIIGTPCYMSPEQARGELRKVDKFSDIYSLGATLYYLVTRCEPFSGSNVTEIISKVISDDPVEPRKIVKEIPKEVELIIMKAMRKERAKRYQSAKEFADDIKHYFEREPLIAEPISQVTRFLKKVRKQRIKLVISTFVLTIIALLIFQWISKIKAEEIAKENARLLLLAEKSINEFDKQLFMPPEDITKKYYLLDDAIKYSQQVIGQTQLHHAYYQMARAYTRKSELQKGLEYINKAIELLNDHEYIFERTLIYNKMYQKSFTESFQTKSMVYNKTPYVELIIADFKLITLQRVSGWKYIFAATLVDLADQKAISDIIQRLQNHIEIEQNSAAKAELLTLQGIIYHYIAGDLANGVKSFEEVIKLKRSDYDSYINLANSYYGIIRFCFKQKRDFSQVAQRAIEILSIANIIKPNNLEIYLLLTDVYLNKAMHLYESGRDAGEDFLLFLEYFERIIKERQDYVHLWCALAVLSTFKERYQMRLKIGLPDIYDQFADLVLKYSKDPEDLFTKMIQYYENSDYDEIGKDYLKGLTCMLKGLYRQKSGKDFAAEFLNALEYFKRTTRFPQTYINRARIYYLMGNYEEAINDWQTASILEPQFKDFAQLMINHAKEKLR